MSCARRKTFLLNRYPGSILPESRRCNLLSPREFRIRAVMKAYPNLQKTIVKEKSLNVRRVGACAVRFC